MRSTRDRMVSTACGRSSRIPILVVGSIPSCAVDVGNAGMGLLVALSDLHLGDIAASPNRVIVLYSQKVTRGHCSCSEPRSLFSCFLS
jgi:hypothetical protein